MSQGITLLELNKTIQETISKGFPESVWIIAEISELKVNRNGHCYIELIEKDAISENIIAKSRATVWSFTYRMLKPYFENTTGQTLAPGLKILVQTSVEFHELYGLSLNIVDIDPNYTLGDLAQKKLQILNQLEEDGVINMNKEIEFPIVPQKIAIISSETAAGYQDFIDQITKNSFDFNYYLKLFPSIMQGDKAEESIIHSLESIYNYEQFFDVVVIIRGGGSQADLSCFDNYNLATNIAQFPLPVLTGIGHDKDESITDIVAYKKLKTPTAVAEFLIEKTLEFNNYLESQKEILEYNFHEYISLQKESLSESANSLSYSVNEKMQKIDFNLKISFEKLLSKSNLFIERTHNQFLTKIEKLKTTTRNNTLTHRNEIKHLESKLKLVDPSNILKRGYSITYFKNKKIKNIDDLKKKEQIITKLFNGNIRSTIDEISKTKNEP